jgi:hypothetical protein
MNPGSLRALVGEEFDSLTHRQHILAHADTWDGMLLHANSHDCTFFGPDPHGQEQTWESLTDEQRAWWIARAKEETP